MGKFRLFFSAVAVSVVLTGCGGGGGGGSTGPTYTGITTPVAINATNAQVIGSKTADGASEAITQDAARNASPFGITISSDSNNINPTLVEFARKIGASVQLLNFPIGITTYTYLDLMNQNPSLNLCGGTVRVSDEFINSVINNGTFNGSMTFINLCTIDPTLGNITMNGTLTFTQTNTEFSIQFSNFSINNNGSTGTVNMTVSCNASGFSCTIAATFEGIDGKVYQIADMSVIEVSTGVYNVSAVYYLPDYGSVTMTATNMTFGCLNGQPDGGTITYIGSGSSSGSITFRGDCSGYDGTWNDGVSSGIFSGDWL